MYLVELELTIGNVCWRLPDFSHIWLEMSEKMKLKTLCPFAYLRQDILHAQNMELSLSQSH